MHRENEAAHAPVNWKHSLPLGIKSANPAQSLEPSYKEKNQPKKASKKPPINFWKKEVKAREFWTEESGKESAMSGVFIVTQTKELVKFFEGI